MRSNGILLIQVNGQPRVAEDSLNLRDLVESLDLKPEQIAIELNQTVIRRMHWQSTILREDDKVEIVQLVHPDKSYEVLEEMVSHVEKLLNTLELPYRILKLCGGDMSFASALTYDFEVYSAAQDKWLEVSSVSNFETFQSNRMKIRFKDGSGKSQFVHTLNGSSLALPRIVACLLENNQVSGGINLPAVLQSYFGTSIIA